MILVVFFSLQLSQFLKMFNLIINNFNDFVCFSGNQGGLQGKLLLFLIISINLGFKKIVSKKCTFLANYSVSSENIII